MRVGILFLQKEVSFSDIMELEFNYKAKKKKRKEKFNIPRIGSGS